jgi:hypothetical protein
MWTLPRCGHGIVLSHGGVAFALASVASVASGVAQHTEHKYDRMLKSQGRRQ